jgi:hypothetical protein
MSIDAAMLTLNGKPFTTSRATYRDVDPAQDTRQTAIYVQVVLPIHPGVSVYALVDTGTPFCIFETEITEALGLFPDQGERITLSTRMGSIPGTIQRLTIRLVAEQGDSLDIDASVFVTNDWGYGNFVGYSGFLERFRFAIDSGTNSFYFGPLA